MAELVISNVSKAFAAQRVLDGVSLSFDKGAYVVLLGPSGSGKSTLLRCIAGLADIDAGSISLAGRVLRDVARGQLIPPERRRLGMVFQSYAVWPHMTVVDNVAYPLRVSKSKDAVALARAALDRVGLARFADRAPGSLSGGQQQRVALARALVMQPDALLLDEPLANLDPHLRAELCDQFRAISRQQGLSVVHVTHDREEALGLGTDLVVLREGRVEQHGSPQAVYEQPRTRFTAELVAEAVSLERPVARQDDAGNAWFQVQAGELRASMRGQAPGNRAWLSLPKKRLRLTAPSEPHLAGAVTQVVYAGGHRVVVVALDNGDSAPVIARIEQPLSAPLPAAGERVAVGCDAAWGFHA